MCCDASVVPLDDGMWRARARSIAKAAEKSNAMWAMPNDRTGGYNIYFPLVCLSKCRVIPFRRWHDDQTLLSNIHYIGGYTRPPCLVCLCVFGCARNESEWNKTNTFTERIEAQVLDQVDARIRYRQCVRCRTIRKSQNHCQYAISMSNELLFFFLLSVGSTSIYSGDGRLFAPIAMSAQCPCRVEYSTESNGNVPLRLSPSPSVEHRTHFIRCRTRAKR